MKQHLRTAQLSHDFVGDVRQSLKQDPSLWDSATRDAVHRAVAHCDQAAHLQRLTVWLYDGTVTAQQYQQQVHAAIGGKPHD